MNKRLARNLITCFMVLLLLALIIISSGCAAQKGMEMSLKKEDGTELDITAGYEFTDGIEVDREPDGSLHIKAGSATVNEVEQNSLVIGMMQMMFEMMMKMNGMPVPEPPPE